ncbi:MAG: 3-oxoadipate enol-lactonase [Solirubrobacterales bacterium]|nr:3-oxoadipate enol-lactonase [Solirubrobacterales bacterium]
MTSCELHFELAGRDSAPALLLGGSLGTTLRMWEPQVRALESQLRLVAFDHRGHGGSPGPPGPYEIADLGRDVLALLDRLGLERACYCGVSIGGMVGLWLGVNAAERVDRLVLISTSAHMDGAAFLQRAAAVRAAGTPEVVADAVVSRWFTPRWAAQHQDVAARYREMISATPAEGYAGCCEAVASFDLRGELSRMAAPTLVIAGSGDPATPPEHGRLIAQAVPDGRLVVVEQAAHLASVEQADAVTSLIAGHLEVIEADKER